MYENEYMYAIERNGDYLAHYGVRGMKWGVRKAIERGNSRALSRQYAKAQKKLAKLEKRAANGKKYAKRAAALGAGAAAAGGLAAAGTAGISSAMTKIGAHGGQAMIKGGKLMNRAGSAMSTGLYNLGKATGSNTLKRIGAHGGQAMINAGNAVSRAGTGVSTGMYTAGKAVRNWGNSNSIAKSAASKYGQLAGKYGAPAAGGEYARKLVENEARGKVNKAIGGVSNNTIARIGAGAVGAGLAAGAGYNAYRAATTKRAARKAAEFRKAMNESFKGTQYANGAPRQGNRKKRRR